MHDLDHHRFKYLQLFEKVLRKMKKKFGLYRVIARLYTSRQLIIIM